MRESNASAPTKVSTPTGTTDCRTPQCFGQYDGKINVCKLYCPFGNECASMTDANDDWKE